MRQRLALVAFTAGALTASWPALAWVGSLAPQGSALAHDEVPYYSHADLLPRWDGWSRGRSVGGVKLVDQSGAAIDQRLFAKGPTVVTFFWSGCISKCPVSIDLLRSAQAGMGAAKPQVLLISDQPMLDSVGMISSYAAKLGLPKDWRLATGEPGQIYGFAWRGLFTDVAARAPDGGPRHSETDYLIDRRGRLRGVYDANSPSDMIRLQGDYARLKAQTTAAAPT